MKLYQFAQFTQGAFANRLETDSNSFETTRVKLLSLKQFNESLGLAYRISKEKSAEITVLKEKLAPQLLTDTISLVLNIHTQKVALLPEKFSGLLLTNNFIKIQLSNEVNAAFFEWYFNEHPAVQKQLSVLSEGTVTSLLKLSNLKNLEFELPPIHKQITIGKIAELKKLQDSLLVEKRELQQLYIQQKLFQSTININSN